MMKGTVFANGNPGGAASKIKKSFKKLFEFSTSILL